MYLTTNNIKSMHVTHSHGLLYYVKGDFPCMGALNSLSIKNYFVWWNGLNASLFLCDDIQTYLHADRQTRTHISSNINEVIRVI